MHVSRQKTSDWFVSFGARFVALESKARYLPSALITEFTLPLLPALPSLAIETSTSEGVQEPARANADIVQVHLLGLWCAPGRVRHVASAETDLANFPAEAS